MRIFIDDKEIYLDGDISVEKFQERVEDYLHKRSRRISHIIVNDKDFYYDLIDYLDLNLEEISSMRIISLSQEEYIFDLLLSKYDYISRAIPSLEELAFNLSRQRGMEDWNSLMEFISGLEWIFSSFEIIDSDRSLNNYLNSYETWNLYAREIYSLDMVVEDLNQGIDQEDRKFLADLLDERIINIFKNMLLILGELLGVRYF